MKIIYTAKLLYLTYFKNAGYTVVVPLNSCLSLTCFLQPIGWIDGGTQLYLDTCEPYIIRIELNTYQTRQEDDRYLVVIRFYTELDAMTYKLKFL